MFGFPAHSKADNFRFKHNLLKTATFQIKYPHIDTIASATGEIVAALMASFPVAKKIENRSVSIENNPESKTPLISNESSLGGLQFETSDNKKVFVITDDSMTMTFLGEAYSHFSEAQSEFCKAAEAVLSLVEINAFTRIGIRKVNGLQCMLPADEPKASWFGIMEDVFNPILAAHLATLPCALSVTSTITNNRFKSDNNYLNLVYGLLPKEIEPGMKQVILDIDLWSQDEYPSLQGAMGGLLNLNNEVFNIFMWSIRSEFINFITN